MRIDEFPLYSKRSTKSLLSGIKYGCVQPSGPLSGVHDPIVV